MKNVNGTVEVTVKEAATGKQKTETMPVSYPEFESSDDVVLFVTQAEPVMDGDSIVTTAADVLKKRISDFLEWVNYGANLKARASIRTVLLSKLEGPDKQINKLVTDIMKARAVNGKPISEAEARKMAILMSGLEIEPAQEETSQTEASQDSAATA